MKTNQNLVCLWFGKEMSLGRGAYGTVKRNGKVATKKFKKLSHLIQEYIAISYLSKCTNIVHKQYVDFSALKLGMDLYDMNMREWLSSKKPSWEGKLKMVKYILYGLIDIHDRGLAHGDLKPSNILVRVKPFTVVIGDLGFTCVEKFVKADRTAATYRDPVVGKSWHHDMFSLGVILLEITTGSHPNFPLKYSNLQELCRKVKDSHLRALISNLLHEKKERRPTARGVLKLIYNKELPPYKERKVEHIQVDEEKEPLYKEIRLHMKDKAAEYEIRRARKGYQALLQFLSRKKINKDKYPIYGSVMLMILSSLFGKSGYREKDIIEDTECSRKEIYECLESLCKSKRLIATLMAP